LHSSASYIRVNTTYLFFPVRIWATKNVSELYQSITNWKKITSPSERIYTANIQCSIKSKPTLALYFLLLFKMESRRGWGKKMDYALAAVELCFMRWKNLIHLRVEKTFKPRFSVRVNSQIYYEQKKKIRIQLFPFPMRIRYKNVFSINSCCWQTCIYVLSSLHFAYRWLGWSERRTFYTHPWKLCLAFFSGSFFFLTIFFVFRQR